MTVRTASVAVAALLATLLGSQPASAQMRFDFKIPFEFVAGSTTLPAGQYEVSADAALGVLMIRGWTGKGPAVVLPIEARAAQSAAKSEIVFETVNGRHYVSELLFPQGDGYVVPVTETAHH